MQYRTPHFRRLPKLEGGDKVAILSPSAGLPELFPWVQDLGLARLRQRFGLQPVEYPTTRRMNASLGDRARDLHQAFADPAIKGVIASIGGNDQIRLLKHLDGELLRANPKPFFGYSDNTHLHNYLWQLGIPSYYGGSIMTQYAMPGEMDGMTARALEQALFHGGDYYLSASPYYSDEDLPWDDPANLDKTRKRETNDGHYWHGDGDACGILWGGCVESLIAQVAAAHYLPANLEGVILCLETAESLPPSWIVRYLLTGFGERGWLAQIQAVLVGRGKAWALDQPQDSAAKAAYRAAQRQTVIDTVRHYNPHIPIVQNLDFGHTDPQIPLPLGREARINGSARRITLNYD